MINFFSKFLLFFGIFFNNFNINAQRDKKYSYAFRQRIGRH